MNYKWYEIWLVRLFITTEQTWWSLLWNIQMLNVKIKYKKFFIWDIYKSNDDDDDDEKGFCAICNQIKNKKQKSNLFLASLCSGYSRL